MEKKQKDLAEMSKSKKAVHCNRPTFGGRKRKIHHCFSQDGISVSTIPYFKGLFIRTKYIKLLAVDVLFLSIHLFF